MPAGMVKGWANPKETTDVWSDASDIQGPVMIRVGGHEKRPPTKADKKRKSLIRPQAAYKAAKKPGDYVYSTPNMKSPANPGGVAMRSSESLSKSAKLLLRLKNF